MGFFSFHRPQVNTPQLNPKLLTPLYPVVLLCTPSTLKFSKSKSRLKSQCDWRSVSKSWCRAPSGAHDQIFVTLWQLRSCFCGASSLTRGWVCLLYMLLALASAVFLDSESLGTRVHILLSQIWDFPFRRLLRLAGSQCRYSSFLLTVSSYSSSARTPRKTPSICCQECMFIGPLPNNGYMRKTENTSFDLVLFCVRVFRALPRKMSTCHNTSWEWHQRSLLLRGFPCMNSNATKYHIYTRYCALIWRSTLVKVRNLNRKIITNFFKKYLISAVLKVLEMQLHFYEDSELYRIRIFINWCCYLKDIFLLMWTLQYRPFTTTIFRPYS
jgi:hypothetical protein